MPQTSRGGIVQVFLCRSLNLNEGDPYPLISLRKGGKTAPGKSTIELIMGTLLGTEEDV